MKKNKNEYKQLIDSEQNSLTYEQKELLKIFLFSENYFISYTLDGNWDFADNFKVIDKIELIKSLIISNNWSFDVSGTSLEEDIYMIEIYLKDNQLKNKVLEPYRKFKDHYLKENIKSFIELYIPYSCILAIYKKNIYKSKIWDKLIQY